MSDVDTCLLQQVEMSTEKGFFHPGFVNPSQKKIWTCDKKEESRTKTKDQATIVHFHVKSYIVQHLNQWKWNENDELVDEIDGLTAIPDNELSNWLRLPWVDAWLMSICSCLKWPVWIIHLT